jgi:hypothetical protein
MSVRSIPRAICCRRMSHVVRVKKKDESCCTTIGILSLAAEIGSYLLRRLRRSCRAANLLGFHPDITPRIRH